MERPWRLIILTTIVMTLLDAAPSPKKVVLSDRLACSTDDQQQPVNRANTTQRLEMLRTVMALFNVDAYVITGDDQHQQTEFVSADNERRRFISGFTGSWGTAVVSQEQAVLWTDGRYYLQADQELDCHWELMKSGQQQVPSVSQWLVSALSPGDRVGADPKLVSANQWLQWDDDLAEKAIQLVALPTNLVDAVWSDASKPSGDKTAYIHDVAYAGKSWRDKVDEAREVLAEQQVEAMVVTALDEVAWLLNLRGSDLPYSPLVEGYVYLAMDRVVLFIEPRKVNRLVRDHLNSHQCQETTGRPICVEIRDYDDVYTDLPRLTAKINSVLLPSKYAYSGGVSFAIYETIPAEKRRTSPSPLILLKAQKNAVEVEGMRNAHLKDAVALCDFLSLLQEQVQEGKVPWDELKVVSTLDDYRHQQELSRGPSFSTIAGFGPNGAVIHYKPSMETNRVIDNSSFLIIDSGGQYLDGTTDVTRTFHFGRATLRQKEIYTRVLMGAIDLASLVFPDTIDDSRIDVIARQHLYEIGLDYGHGTGHGIGSFLNVHESPTQLRINSKEPHPFRLNYFFSDEPGYYEENEFGIRLETILRVVVRHDINNKATHQHRRGGNRFLGFEPVTLVPFEPNLILADVMTSKQLKWLNDYHQLVRTRVGAELKRQNRTAATSINWLISKTLPLPLAPDPSVQSPTF